MPGFPFEIFFTTAAVTICIFFGLGAEADEAAQARPRFQGIAQGLLLQCECGWHLLAGAIPWSYFRA